METATAEIDQELLDKYMSMVEKVKNGEANALDVYPKLNELKNAIDGLRKEISDHAVQEREKYDPKEDVIRGGYRISTQRRMYPKYSQDDEYSFINQKLKARKSLIKEATEKGRPLTDSETGETVEPVDATFSEYPVCEFIGNQGLS